MTKSDTVKPQSAVMFSKLSSSILASRYLHEFFGEHQVPPGPVDINGFVFKFLQLDMMRTLVDLPYIKAFIFYSSGMYFNTLSDYPIPVEPGTVILNQDIQADSPEERFVLAHEAGHWIVNRERTETVRSNYSCCKSFDKRTDYLDIEMITHYIATDSDAWSEIEADCMANAILMPTGAFLSLATDLMHKFGFADEKIIVGKHHEAETALVNELADTFLVPEYAVRNHLYSYGFLARD